MNATSRQDGSAAGAPPVLGFTIQVDEAMRRLVRDLVRADPRVFRVGQANLRYALERRIYFALAGEKSLEVYAADPAKAAAVRELPFWVNLILPYLRGERLSFGRSLGMRQWLLREIYLRRGEADIDIAGIDAGLIDILFLVIQPKFVHYLHPIAEKLGPRCAFLTIEDPEMFAHLANLGLPRVHVGLSAATEAQFASSIRVLLQRYTRGPFDDWPIRINALRGAFALLQPRCIVVPEGNADVYEIVNQAAKLVRVPTFCVQQGWSPIVHAGFRNMSYTAMSVCGEGFAELLEPHNPEQRFLVIGNHNITCHAQGDVRKRRAIGFFLQNGAPWMAEATWGEMLDLVRWTAQAFPEFEIRVRDHPGQQLTAAELSRISAAPNIRVMSPGRFGLDQVIDGCRVVVAMSSTTILEGAAAGAVPLILNVNGLGPYSPDIVTFGGAVEVGDFEQARVVVSQLAGDDTYVATFAPALDRVRQRFFKNDGTVALNLIAEAIDGLCDRAGKGRRRAVQGKRQSDGGTGSGGAPSKGTIYLVNQISNHGHLDMYARIYSKCLLDLGYDVTLVAEREAGVVAWVAARHRGDASFNFHSRSLSLAQRGASYCWEPSDLMLLCRRALQVWQEEALSGLVDRLSARMRNLASKVAWVLWRSSRAPRSLLARALARFEKASLMSDPTPGMSIQPWVDDVHAAARKFGQSPSLVFFLYLDMVAESRVNRRLLAKRLGARWAGILFHPRCLDGPDVRASERYFSVANCAGAAFLNPRAVSAYEAMYPGRVFVSLPDVTDADLPDSEPDLVREIRARANGRTIVLAIGSIAPHKGVVGLIDVIRAADSSRFFFVIAGEIFWDSFGNERSALREFCENPPENCMVHSRYIESERDVNAVIATADVLYAVYRDFKDSSNSLTKASIFEKPLLVSDGYLMAERVLAYRLGAAVKFGDVSSIAAGLDEVRARPRSEFGFSAYREAHSLNALRERFAACMQAWLEIPAAGATKRQSAS